MAEWPSTLPPPQKRISLTPGDTRKIRDSVSGRKEIRRMGSGAPDQIRILFRLTWAQWAIFKRLHEWDLNLGLNWFSASWLTTLGYSAHKARLLGYPREVARQQYFVDVIATLLVQATADIIGEDTLWPCAATGEVGPSIPDWAVNAAIYCDVDLSAESQSADWVDGSAITSWQNQTNEGLDLVTFGAIGPTYRAAGWSGYPAGVEFSPTYNGSLCKLKTHHGDSSLVSSGVGWSIAFCLRARKNDGGHDNYLTRVIKSGGASEGWLYFIGTLFCALRYFTTSVYTLAFPDFRATSDYTAIHIIELHSDGSEVKTYLDGVLKYTIVSAVKFVELSDSNIYFGQETLTQKYTVPGLYHMIIYHADSPMSESDRTAMRNACSSQYGVTL